VALQQGYRMNGFDGLLKCAGEWAGRNRVQPYVNEPADESSSRLTVTPILNGTFLRVNQQWSWKGEPQLGCMLIGYLPDEERATIHWIDTWHNGRRSMTLTGEFEVGGKLVAHGSFPVNGEQDWGWRMEIHADDDGLIINMFCINPANWNDEGWVWSTFARSNG
jgi:hypothetical protein